MVCIARGARPGFQRIPMPVYRCYFLDRHDHIQAADNIEVDALNEAIDRALVMLRARPQHHSVEVWQGPVRLYNSQVPVD